MRFRMGVLIGLGIGYVLGARAGRVRYVEMQRRLEGVVRSTPVRNVVEPVRRAVEEAMARTGTEDAPELSADQLRERLGHRESVSETRLGGRKLPGEMVRERM